MQALLCKRVGLWPMHSQPSDMPLLLSFLPFEQMAKGDASCEAAGGADAQNRCCANKIVEKTVQDDEFCGKVRACCAALCNAATMLQPRCTLACKHVIPKPWPGHVQPLPAPLPPQNAPRLSPPPVCRS